MSVALSILLLVLMLAALVTVPFGAPGVWIMVVLMAVALAFGMIGWKTWLLIAGLTAIAEVSEFYLLKKVGDRYGASGKAFWGAILGGLVGVFVGMPVPLIGSVLAAFLGTFVGAGLVTLAETRSVGDAGRVGFGVVLARTGAVALKVGVGFVILVIAGFALFF